MLWTAFSWPRIGASEGILGVKKAENLSNSHKIIGVKEVMEDERSLPMSQNPLSTNTEQYDALLI
jgi:hypothetical protein